MGWLMRLLGMERSSPRTQGYYRDVVDEFAAERRRVQEAGSVDGAHYTDHVERVKQMKREGRFDEAIALLTQLVVATESESKAAGAGWGVAPWYYEQLAIIYRKQKRFRDEVAILERYESQSKAPGVGPSKLAERLAKARQLASGSQ